MIADYDELYTYGGNTLDPENTQYRIMSYPLYDPPDPSSPDLDEYLKPNENYV
jgi:hypothetical protein